MKKYFETYKKFLTRYDSSPVDGAEIGKTIAEMVVFFCESNDKMVSAERKLNIINAKFSNQIDEATGKQVSMTKADALTKASEEYAIYQNNKTDLQNIEQCINALKSLQRGVLNEYNKLSAS